MNTQKKQSLSSTTDQLTKLNSNVISILSGLSDVVSSTNDKIQVTVLDENGDKKIVTLPSVGFLHSEIKRLESNLSMLSGLEGNGALVQTADRQFQRLIAADINLQPADISDLASASTFTTSKNWFFDSLLNPQLFVEIDLTGKIQNNVRKVLSRRFIVKFERDEVTGELTTDAVTRLAEFNRDYKGQSNVDITQFVTWLGQAGIENRLDPDVDEQVFDLEPARLRYNGTFTVLETEEDTLNRKLWYVLDTLTYRDVQNASSPADKTLTIGDTVAVIPSDPAANATSVYKVVEISTATSKLRVRFEKVGKVLEPIPVRNNAIQIYSPLTSRKSVRISIGFDEHCVVFLKPIGNTNNLLAKNWSMGTGFYTSELTLQSASGTYLKNYYVQYVYDYGKVLQDLVAKKIPISVGETPNAPTLNSDNFKVVQINKHLTDTADSAKLRTLNNTKNSLNSEIEQLRDAVTKQLKTNQRKFKSKAEQNKAEADLVSLRDQLESKTKLLESTVTEIVTAKKNITNVEPKYRVRGFWFIPDPIQTANSIDQEIIQFEYQYRYSSRSGSDSQVEIFKTTEGSRVENGAFSSWVTVKSDVRKRTYNAATGVYEWVIEDISDADTPNINQIDIPIQSNEKIEIRVRSLSEVGWPETPLTSDWSEALVVEFPDDIAKVLDETDFMLREATQEEVLTKFRKDLASQGLGQHLSTSFQSGDKYFAHNGSDIAMGTDENGQSVSLTDAITDLRLRVAQLEEQIRRAKGELKLVVNVEGKDYEVSTDSINQFVIEMENVVSMATGGTTDSPFTFSNKRTYKNDVYVYKGIQLKVYNKAVDSPLSILSSRTYGSGTGLKNTAGIAFNTSSVQATWVDASDTVIVNGGTTGAADTVDSTSGYYRTQQNYQWMWAQIKDSTGTDLYQTPGTDHPTDSEVHTVLTNKDGKNYGISYAGSGYGSVGTDETDITDLNITSPAYWTKSQGYTSGALTKDDYGYMAATVHPQIQSLDTITEAGNEKLHLRKAGLDNGLTIPLNVYFKMSTVGNLFDKDSTNVEAGYENTVCSSIMAYLAVSTISKATNAVVTFTKSAGYTGATGVATVAVTGSGASLTLNTTDSSGEITAATVNAGGSGYVIGDVVSISGGSTTAYAVVSKVSSTVVTKVKIVRVESLSDMGLGASDYLVVDGVTGMVEVNNKLARVASLDTSNNTITAGLNSTNFTTYSAGGLLAMLTDVHTVRSKTSGPASSTQQVWNSVGRDSTNNSPINSSIFVVNDSVGVSVAPYLTRTVRFYIEPELGQPVEFTIRLLIRQYRNAQLAASPAATYNSIAGNNQLTAQ